jgi:hypothetical protein
MGRGWAGRGLTVLARLSGVFGFGAPAINWMTAQHVAPVRIRMLANDQGVEPSDVSVV